MVQSIHRRRNPLLPAPKTRTGASSWQNFKKARDFRANGGCVPLVQGRLSTGGKRLGGQ
ncbi:MAG TPA: hypothetical protein V6C89_06510 [Drouetiella sp.]